jgi:hypothetical protein
VPLHPYPRIHKHQCSSCACPKACASHHQVRCVSPPCRPDAHGLLGAQPRSADRIVSASVSRIRRRSRWHARNEPSRKSMLQQGGNQVVDCNRALTDNNPILRLGLTQRASVQRDRAVADRRNRLSVAVSLIEETTSSVMVLSPDFYADGAVGAVAVRARRSYKKWGIPQ